MLRFRRRRETLQYAQHHRLLTKQIQRSGAEPRRRLGSTLLRVSMDPLSGKGTPRSQNARLPHFRTSPDGGRGATSTQTQGESVGHNRNSLSSPNRKHCQNREKILDRAHPARDRNNSGRARRQINTLKATRTLPKMEFNKKVNLANI